MHTSGCLDDVDDVGASDPGGRFEEQNTSRPRDEFRVRDAVVKTESGQQRAVRLEERRRFGTAVMQPPRHEHPALMRNGHRWAAVLRRDGKHDRAVPHDRVDVVDVAGDELLEQAPVAIAGSLERWPQFVAPVHLAQPGRGG